MSAGGGRLEAEAVPAWPPLSQPQCPYGQLPPLCSGPWLWALGWRQEAQGLHRNKFRYQTPGSSQLSHSPPVSKPQPTLGVIPQSFQLPQKAAVRKPVRDPSWLPSRLPMAPGNPPMLGCSLMETVRGFRLCNWGLSGDSVVFPERSLAGETGL